MDGSALFSMENSQQCIQVEVPRTEVTAQAKQELLTLCQAKVSGIKSNIQSSHH